MLAPPLPPPHLWKQWSASPTTCGSAASSGSAAAAAAWGAAAAGAAGPCAASRSEPPSPPGLWGCSGPPTSRCPWPPSGVPPPSRGALLQRSGGRRSGAEPTGPIFFWGSFRVITHHAVDGQQLVPSLQAAVALGHASRDDAGDVDGRVLLLAPHHVESQPLLRLRKLHHPRVGVAFAGCEGGNCGLKGRELALAQRSNLPKPSKTYPVFYKNCKSRNPFWNKRWLLLTGAGMLTC